MKSLSNLITHMPMAMVVFDSDMEILSVSREAFLMFGVPFHPNELERCQAEFSKKIFDNQELVALIGASTLKLQRVGSSDELCLNSQDNYRALKINVFTLPGDDDAILYGVSFLDITAQLKTESSRDSLRNYLERVLDSLPLGVAVMDSDMKITSINTAQLETIRMINEDMSVVQAVGMNASELFSSQDDISWKKVRGRILDNGETIKGVSERTLGEESGRILSVTLAPLLNYKNEIIGAIRISEDTTSQMKLREEERKTEVLGARLETVRQIAVTLNHEINTALTGIVANVDIMQKIGDPFPESKLAQLESVRKEADRITDFVKKFTDIKEIKTVSYLEDRDEQMMDV